MTRFNRKQLGLSRNDIEEIIEKELEKNVHTHTSLNNRLN